MSYQLSTHRNSIDVSSNKTLAVTDAGTAQVATAGLTFTLPATTAVPVGTEFCIINGGEGATDGTLTINVSPAAADKIQGGPSGTATDDKDLINTNGRGGLDYLVLRSDGVDGWVVSNYNGTWTRQA